jgi:hypothetical protein
MIKIYNTFYIPEEKIVVVSTQGRIRQWQKIQLKSMLSQN